METYQKMKVCKIIATCFNERKVRNRKQPNWIVEWPAHIQFGFSGSEVCNKMLRDIIYLEKHTDPGLPMDTILINNDVGCVEGNEYVASLNNQKTHSGTLFSFTKDNIGGQFGAYDFAFSLFPDYDYYLLDEDDIIVTGDKYYKNLLDLSEGQCYALLGIENHPQFHIHATGAMLLLPQNVLSDIKSKYGSLPYPTSNDQMERIIHGEVAFSEKIHACGYNFIYKGTKSWDLNNYCLPYRELIEKFGL